MKALIAAVVAALSLTGSGGAYQQQGVVVRPVTGKLLVRAYADSNKMELIAGAQDGCGAALYVDGKPISFPMRDPIVLTPGSYAVSVAYPDRNGAEGRPFAIVMQQVTIGAGGGALLHFPCPIRDWKRVHALAVPSPLPTRNRGERLEALAEIEATLMQTAKELQSVGGDDLFQVLSAHLERPGVPVHLTNLPAFDQERGPTTATIQVNGAQIRWIGDVIKNRYDLGDYHQGEYNETTRLASQLEKILGQASSAGERDIVQRVEQSMQWLKEIKNSDASVFRGVEDLIQRLAERADANSQAISTKTDPQQVAAGTTRDSVTGVAFEDATHVVVQTQGGAAPVVTRVADGKRVATFEMPEDYGYYWRIVASGDGKRLFSSGGEGFGSQGFVCEWDRRGRTMLSLLDHVPDRPGARSIIAIAATSDGDRMLGSTGPSEPHLKLWRTKDWTQIWLQKFGRCFCVAISPDELTLAAGCKIVSEGSEPRNALSIRRMSDGGEIRSIPIHGTDVCSLAFTSDGRRVFGGCDDGTLRVWDTGTGAQVASYARHLGRVERLLMIGTRLVSGGEDGTIRIWNVSTGEETLLLRGHSGTVMALAVSPSGTQLLSGSDDRTWRIWELPR